MLYKAKPYLDKHSLLSLYLSYILSYISYGSIAWESTIRTNLKKYTVSRNMISELYIIKIGCHITLFKECRILIIYQACICKNLLFMHQINSDTIPSIIFNKFNKPTHNYSTNFAKTNYGISPFKLSKWKYRNSIRGPTLWNNIPINTEKKQQKKNIFKTIKKNKLPALENELTYFYI